MTAMPLTALLFGWFGSGCVRSVSAPLSVKAPALAASSSRGAAVELDGEASLAALRRSASYQQAERRFRSGDASGALQQIETLLQEPSRTDTERAFLQRQQRICRQKLGLPLPAEIAPKTTVATSRAGSPGSADAADCGPRALLSLCQRMHIPADLSKLRSVAQTDADGTSLEGLQKAAESVGLTARAVQMDEAALKKLDTPAIAWVDGNHYIALLQVKTSIFTGKSVAVVHDPNTSSGKEEEIALSALLSRSGGILLLLDKLLLDKR